MEDNDVQRNLNDLLAEVGAPLVATPPDAKRVKADVIQGEAAAAAFANPQAGFDYLRLSIKYLLFDLESTRRENNYLRKMLEDLSDGSENV